MTYDFRRLRRRGIITRLLGTFRYFVTPFGLRFAFLFTKIHKRILKPAWAALLPTPTASPHTTNAINTLDKHLLQLIQRARLQPAA